MSVDANELLAYLSQHPSLKGLLHSVHQFPAREAVFGSPTNPLHPRLLEHLERIGFDRLYTHQAMAFDAAIEGNDLAVVTGTNSGKTLCYNLPVIHKLLDEPAARALYLFPTKALAQDQLGRLEQLLPGADIRCATYDGDTPKSKRALIRNSAHVVITNADMLHVGILPKHETWGRFFRSLRAIVIDEMHSYRGVFGSHVALVLRRLIRLCDWYGSRPQIIACSATISNPVELFVALTGRRPVLLDQDGSPQGEKVVALLAEEFSAEASHRSPNRDAAQIVSLFCEHKARNLTFCRSRVATEIILSIARRLLMESGMDPSLIESYRSGYTQKERRQIEKAVYKGKLLGLVATSAMEMGVDIGELDSVIVNGFPGTIGSFRQQIGRAGRKDRNGLGVLIAHADPMEQYLVRRSELLFESSAESANVSTTNQHILAQQLRCASYERPLGRGELEAISPVAIDVADSELEFQAGRYFYPSHEPPAPAVSIRGTAGNPITLYCGDEEVGEMERWRALQSAHEGAIYLHRGSTYVVKKLDLAGNRAEMEEHSADHYTKAIVQAVVEPSVEIARRPWGLFTASLTGLRVTSAVLGYKEMSFDGEQVLNVHELSLPPMGYDTIGVQIDLPQTLIDPDDESGAVALHSAEHALLAVAPILAGCDQSDLGSAWYNVFPATIAPALFVYDAVPGGVGLCEGLFQHMADWARAAMDLLTSCSCKDGCPACLLASWCDAGNKLLSKQAALSLIVQLSEEFSPSPN